ncbi:Os01g0817633 [Oryza sativa Japonica Group]|uniref:Os01g0817633 protein n=1 Tax=Oryza sativa subsp. japonica TaxID=39947 RepID=A0A0P0V9N3_ORYSJ|nr:hypothetical protein EE612_006479 [Oryza sativa]BAS74935.1 Os01g0817633 [Oryza sativa Japonica Group]
MASDTPTPGCTTSRNTSVPTASLGRTSATARLSPSYTTQHRRAYDPSTSYAADAPAAAAPAHGVTRASDLPPPRPVRLTAYTGGRRPSASPANTSHCSPCRLSCLFLRTVKAGAPAASMRTTSSPLSVS